MICIKHLLAKTTRDISPRLLCNGLACWLVRDQPLQESFAQAMSDMGGWSLAEEKKQSLWFFPFPGFLLGLARLHNWSQLNGVQMTIVVFEASLVVGAKLEQSLKVKSDIENLCVDPPRKFLTFISERIQEVGQRMRGLHLKQATHLPGLTGKWLELEVIRQVSAPPAISWLWMIRPQGARDESFTKGWRAYFERLSAIFTQQNIAYLHAEDNSLVLRVSTLRSMVRLSTELLTMMADKQAPPWPCQYLAMEMGDQDFSPDFSTKNHQLLGSLEANALYMPLATIYQLADPRLVPLVSRISVNSTKITDFFQVGLLTVEGGRQHGSLDIFLPGSLVVGRDAPCFYCGLRTHQARECPSRNILPGNIQVTDLARFSRIGLDVLPEILGTLDTHLASASPEVLTSLMDGRGEEGIVLSSLFEINMACQLRTVEHVWKARGRDWPLGITDQWPKNDVALQEAVENMRAGNFERATEKLDVYRMKYPKSYQPRVLLGFMALERGDAKRVESLWKEAESLATSVLQRSYLLLLQGRLREVAGDFSEAIHFYTQALRESPGFAQARYRQAVALVKSGYMYEAQSLIRELIQTDPDYFNIALLDPEMESGRSHLLSDLWELLEVLRAKEEAFMGEVKNLPELLGKWLPEDHVAYKGFYERIKELDTHSGIRNYASMIKVLRGATGIRLEIQSRVKTDIHDLAERRIKMLERLGEIRREASWFPFPRFLEAFHDLLNVSRERLRFVRFLNLQIPEKFRTGYDAMREVESNLTRLEEQLALLRSLRQTTLFLFLLGRNLVCYELAALILAGSLSAGLYFLVPQLSVLGIDMRQNHWAILNGLLIFFSILAVSMASFITWKRFDTHKARVLGPPREKEVEIPKILDVQTSESLVNIEESEKG